MEHSSTASLRHTVLTVSLVSDVAAVAASYVLALVAWALWRGETVGFSLQPVWSLPLLVAVVVASLAAFGAYKTEAYVSRPLHVWIFLKACVVALVATAFVAFAFHAQAASYSRVVLFGAVVTLFVVGAVLRLAVIDKRLVRGRLRALGETVIIGQSTEAGLLASRLRELRGYHRVRCVAAVDGARNGDGADPQALAAVSTQPAPAHVFLDVGGLGHVAVLQLMAAARERGSEVYVISRYLSPLDSTGLLSRLFELPVMRVRGSARGRHEPVKRVFDVVAALLLLALLSPLLLVLALLVKASSPGPVLYRQARVGRRGESFDVLKFRTMRHGNDPALHEQAAASFANGDTAAVARVDADGREILKLSDDPRVTRVGALLRKFSLDELPQLVNVLRGDMSVVGPRPHLAYEVAAYRDWHRRRLDVAPGMTGLWQVMGRSRVSFDEMVFEDVMYSYNQSLLTDLGICVRTVPVVLTARGAA